MSYMSYKMLFLMFDKTAVVLLVRIVSSLHGGIWHELKLKLRYENQFDYEPSQFYLKKKKITDQKRPQMTF